MVNGANPSYPAPLARAEGHLRLFGGLEQVHRLMDRGQRELEQYAHLPMCVENCGLCCVRTTPSAAMLEATYLAGSVVAAEPERLQWIRRRAFAWLQEEVEGLADAEELPPNQRLSKAQSDRLQADHTKLACGRCPFLTDDLRCGIHPWRPLACRGFGITSAADSWCPRPLMEDEAPNRRIRISPASDLGLLIQGSVTGLWRSMRQQRRSDLLKVGLFPTLVAETLDLAEVERLRDAGKIQPAKLGAGYDVVPNLFLGEDF